MSLYERKKGGDERFWRLHKRKRQALLGLELCRMVDLNSVIIAVLAFVLGFFVHMAWAKRQQMIGIWNNLLLYYQD